MYETILYSWCIVFFTPSYNLKWQCGGGHTDQKKTDHWVILGFLLNLFRLIVTLRAGSKRRIGAPNGLKLERRKYRYLVLVQIFQNDQLRKGTTKLPVKEGDPPSWASLIFCCHLRFYQIRPLENGWLGTLNLALGPRPTIFPGPLHCENFTGMAILKIMRIHFTTNKKITQNKWQKIKKWQNIKMQTLNSVYGTN